MCSVGVIFIRLTLLSPYKPIIQFWSSFGEEYKSITSYRTIFFKYCNYMELEVKCEKCFKNGNTMLFYIHITLKRIKCSFKVVYVTGRVRHHRLWHIGTKIINITRLYNMYRSLFLKIIQAKKIKFFLDHKIKPSRLKNLSALFWTSSQLEQT